jgi:hypothetical protein
MPRSTSDIVNDINDMLRLKGGPVLTMTWPDFYKLCDMTRFKDARGEAIADNARDHHGLFVGYGKNAVIIAHDRNFEP